jgi:hypothetical protein
MKIKPLTWPLLILLFGVPTILNAIACEFVIPALFNSKSMPIEISYFLSVGLIVLVPMFIGAISLSGWEVGSYKIKSLFNRMRIKRLNKVDTIWAVAAFILLSLSSYLIAKIILPAVRIYAAPFFFRNMPLNNKYMYILYVWPPFFFFNIFSEEFLWRGYIQPRQELLNGRMTWLVQGILWAVFHFPMGIGLMISAMPIFFILPA